MSEEHNIYYNARLYNDTTQEIDANIKDVQASALVNRAYEYRMSIIRFEINGFNFPSLIPRITSPAPPYTTEYFLSIAHNGFVGTANIIFSAPININKQIPLSYDSVNEFLNDLNNALSVAFAGLVLQTAVPVTYPPTISYNSDTRSFELYVEDGYNSYVPNNMQIHMNYQLFNLFNTFDNTFNGYNRPFFDDFTLIVSNNNSVLLPPVGTRYTYPPVINALVGNIWLCKQETSSIGQFNPIDRIFLTTSCIPIETEQNPGSILQSRYGGVSDNSVSIVTDFVLQQNDPYNGQILYLPTAQYRYISLKSVNEIRTIDLKFRWISKNGEQYPIRLSPQYACSAKILFEKLI